MQSPPRSRDAHHALHLSSLVVAGLMLLPVGWLVLHAAELLDEPAASAFFSAETREALWAGLILAVGVTVASVAVAVPLGWLTHATDLPFRRAFRVLLNLPLAVPSYVTGFVVVAAFGPAGWAQEVLGRTIADVYGYWGAWLALLFTYPYALIPVQAALARMDPRQWDAARSLGATPVRAFASVVLPRLRGAIGAGGLLVALYAMSDFGAVSLLRYESLSYVIYVRYRSLFDKEEAIFLALLLALVALAFIVVYRFVRGNADGRGVQATARIWPVVPLGRWRWPAFGFCALVVAAGLGLPVATVGVWLVRGLGQGNTLGDVTTETWTTLGVGTVAALITVGIALIPALVGRFGNPRLARAVHASSHVGYALPGIVVALSLVFFAIRFAGPFYQTTALLVFAYVVRFLPLAVGVLEDGLDAQNPRLYDAARSLGCPPVAAWGRVVLPCAGTAVIAGLLIVFMSVIKELPATLLLSPLDFSTLATRIWSLTEEAFFTAAAPPVLILVVLAGAALWLRPNPR